MAVRLNFAFVINMIFAMHCYSISGFCITVTLCSNGPAGPSYIPVTYISHHCIPCQWPDIQLTDDTVSSSDVMYAAAEHTVLDCAYFRCMSLCLP